METSEAIPIKNIPFSKTRKYSIINRITKYIKKYMYSLIKEC